jgi:hypothetical protein
MAGTTPTASISAVDGPLTVYDVHGASGGTPQYIVDPPGSATVMDSGNGWILVKGISTKPYVIVQVVISGEKVATAALLVEPQPPIPGPVDPTPPTPVDPPKPIPPGPVTPPANSGKFSIIIVHDPATDSAAVKAGLGNDANPASLDFWASQRSVGRGVFVVTSASSWAAKNSPAIIKSGGPPCVIIMDSESKQPLAGDSYTGDNQAVLTLIDSLLPKPPSPSKKTFRDDWGPQ